METTVSEFPDGRSGSEPADHANMERVHTALDRLPEIYKSAILLHYSQGLSYEETAAVLGCSAGTIGSRLATARARMKELLTGSGAAALVPAWEGVLKTNSAGTPAPGPALTKQLLQIASVTSPAKAGVPFATAVAGAGAFAAAVVAAVILISPLPGAADTRMASVAGGGALAPGVLPAADPLAGELAQGQAPRVPVPPRAESRPAGAVATESMITYVVHGTLVHETTGKPVANAPVAIDPIYPRRVPQQKGNLFGEGIVTDSDGKFTITVRTAGPGVYMCTAGDRAGKLLPRQRVIEVLKSGSETITIETGPQPEDYREKSVYYDYALLEALQRAFERDQVAFATGIIQQAGPGIVSSQMQLRVIDPDGDTADMYTVIDYKTGRFIVGPLAAGTHHLEAVAGSDGYAVARNLQIKAGTPVKHLALTLRSGNATISGRVEDAEGRPVAGATILAVPSEIEEAGLWIPETAKCESSADGTFQLINVGGAGDTLRLSATLGNYRDAKLAQVSAGSNSVVLKLVKNPFLKCKVISKATGKPPEGHFSMGVSLQSAARIRTKSSFQTMEAGSSYDSRDGSLGRTLYGTGSAEVTIETIITGKVLARRTIEIGDSDIDLGVIELP